MECSCCTQGQSQKRWPRVSAEALREAHHSAFEPTFDQQQRRQHVELVTIGELTRPVKFAAGEVVQTPASNPL